MFKLLGAFPKSCPFIFPSLPGDAMGLCPAPKSVLDQATCLDSQTPSYSVKRVRRWLALGTPSTWVAKEKSVWGTFLQP